MKVFFAFVLVLLSTIPASDAITEGSIRLIGSTRSTGRVEIYYNGQWGTVCDDYWDTNDAKVVCRQLGFPTASNAYGSAKYGQGTGQIWMDSVKCLGNESRLSDCGHRGWGSHSCSHSEDASVQCSYGSFMVRLVGGGANFGRVEIRANGQWGTVCDDSWDINDANVVCRHLGFPKALQAFSSATHGQGTGPIWLDNLACSGSEPHLYDCRNRGWMYGWGSHNCGHSEDAGVECSVIRLVGGGANFGRVEIYENGKWGTVCDDAWDMNDADVACRQLGFSGATSAPRYAAYGEGCGPILRDHIRCVGTEASLLSCTADQVTPGHCVHSEDSSVVCY
ncbi:scavenger receptor cysteine-rich domain-containing protein DMBT1-like [Oculina patagonica]